jgi:uncharacterized protein (DUF362 family)
MSSFLNLVTVYEHPGQRNIEFLRQVYNDTVYLQRKVLDLFSDQINNKNIKGKHILIKPNWVNHDRNQEDDICLRTHNNLILAVVKVLLTYNPLKITIGDAPIQGCNWDKMCLVSFVNEVSILSISSQIPIIIKDFRRVAFDSSNNKVSDERNPISDYIIFDAGVKSFLEPISFSKKDLFRVAHYDYKRLAEMHHKGVHKYCITKILFEADIVISMPKIKTHQKAGITGALKNLVGINGDKDYLPHHRKGGTKKGGDSYPGNNTFVNISERLLDISNKNIGKPLFRYCQKMAIAFWKLSKPGKDVQWGAAWYGNDTTWRMVLDLNQIAIYGNIDGTLADKPQRQIYSLCDAIIGGQGDGPLLPKPLALGFLSFTNNAALNDYIFACIMKLNPEKIALLTNAFQLFEHNFDNIKVEGKLIQLSGFNEYAIDTLLPPGWVEYMNR